MSRASTPRPAVPRLRTILAASVAAALGFTAGATAIVAQQASHRTDPTSRVSAADVDGIVPAPLPAPTTALPDGDALAEDLAQRSAHAEDLAVTELTPPEPAPVPTSAPEPPAHGRQYAGEDGVGIHAHRTYDWDELAECESSGRWQETRGTYEGGLQFHPQTWDAYKDPGMPDAASEASRVQQMAIAEHVLDDQGWDAWPSCSSQLGWR